MEERKVAGLLLILLVLSLEFNRLAVFRASAQLEDFASRLESLLKKAVPEDLLAEECEYTVPDGFRNALAEKLWRYFSFYVSAGYATGELRSVIKRQWNSTLVNETLSDGRVVALNVSSVTVERSLEDGSVSIRIPVISGEGLSYSRYNFTKAGGFEVWNRTLVRKYRIWRLEPGWYEYTMRFLETNRSMRVVSRVYGADVRVSFRGIETVEWSGETGELPVFTYSLGGILLDTFVIAVPGHYEDVSVVIPQQEVNYRVLFPAYDPLIGWGWVVYTNISSTSVSPGETLEVSYSAEYESPMIQGGEEPLNATIILSAPDSFDPLDSTVRRLDDTHAAGVFRLRPVRPGLYNLTLRLEGNACFRSGGKEETYTVQVVSLGSPSLSIGVADMDESVLKHARLRIRLSNNGGGVARNIRVEITGEYIQGVSRTLEDIGAGETRVEEFTLRLLNDFSSMEIRVAYSDDNGNPYMVFFRTSLVFRNVWVPEHYETYTTIVPQHEETRRVFIPGYEGATHVKLYALWNPYTVGAVVSCLRHGEGECVLNKPIWAPWVYGVTPELSLYPVPVPGLGSEISLNTGEEALKEAGVKIMVASIEPYYNYLGVFKEEDALKLINTDKESLRSGNLTYDFRVESLKPYWVEGRHVAMNTTEFALYQARMEELKKTNPDIDYSYRSTLIDVRTRIGEAEPGCITLVYRPLKIVGDGPLKTVRVRNLAGIGFDYRVDFEASEITLFSRKTNPEKTWQYLYLEGREDAVLFSSNLNDADEQEVTVNLTYNGRLVAQARFTLKPESSPYWRGFWDGLASQSWKIAISLSVMIIVGFVVPAGSVATVSKILLGVGVAMNLIEVGTDICNAYAARDEMNALADEAEKRAREYLARNSVEHANESLELAHRLRAEANATIDNLGINMVSNLLIDVAWDEVSIALGWKEPLVQPGESREYRIGYCRGRVAGAILLSVMYAGFYTLVSKIRAERIAGEPLSISQVLRLMGRGVYNWITPAIWDAIVLARGRITGFANSIADLLLGNKYSGRFGETIGNLVESLNDPPRVGDVLDASSGLSRKVLENVPDRESSTKILDALGLILEEYSPEDLRGKGSAAARILVSLWEGCGDEAVESVSNIFQKSRASGEEVLKWLGLSQQEELRKAATLIPKIAELNTGELEDIEKTLAKVGGSFENGLKLFDAYFTAREHYDWEIVKLFLDNVAKHPERLDMWVNVFARDSKIVLLEPDSHDSLIIEGKAIDPGIYRVVVIDQGSGEIVAEGVRGTVEEDGSGAVVEKKTLRFKEAQFDTGKEYPTVFMEYGVKDFFQDVEAPPRFARLGEEDRVLLVTGGGEPVAELDANVKAASGFVYLELEYGDVDGYKQRFRLSISGELYIGQVAKGETVFKQRVVGIGFKVFDDGAGRVLAKLLEIEYGEKASPMHLVAERSIPEVGTFLLRDRDGLMKVSQGQTKFFLGEDFEKVLGKKGLENLGNMLGSKKAALALVYVGEDNNVHSVWSQELEFSFKHHPVKEDGIIGLYVVRVDGVDGVDLVGKAVRLASTTGGYELIARVEDGEIRIPVEEPYVDTMGARKYLKMMLLDGHVLGLRMDVDESGKLNAKLAIYRASQDTFRDLRLLKLVPEMENYYGQSDKPDVLRNILVGEYVEEDETKPIFISMDGSIKREILDKLNNDPKHTLLEINAISFFKNRGETIVAIEKKLKLSETNYRVIDIMTEDQDGNIALVECKHGYETWIELKQIEDYFTYAEMQMSNGEKLKIRLFIGNDITGQGAKKYVKRAIELSKQFDVPLEIYIKGELKSINEVKQMVGG